jgi:hypothetical protein
MTTCSSGRCTVAEASATEVGRIELKTRAIASKAGTSIFLFFSAASYYPENPEKPLNSYFPFKIEFLYLDGRGLRACPEFIEE